MIFIIMYFLVVGNCIIYMCLSSCLHTFEYIILFALNSLFSALVGLPKCAVACINYGFRGWVGASVKGIYNIWN